MAKLKSVTKTQLQKELPSTICDMPTCAKRAEIIVADDDFWLTFCTRHDPKKLSVNVVYPKKGKTEGK